MNKRLGYIAMLEGNYPISDSNGDAILFPTREDAMDCPAGDKTKGAPRGIVSVYPVVRWARPRTGAHS